MGKTWRIVKKLFFIIFILHTVWFAIFIFRQFSNADFPVENLKIKVLLVILGLAFVVLLYYYWLQHFTIIKKIGRIVKEAFFIVYISSFIYLLAGIFFNPPLTITQLHSLIQGHGLKRNYVSYQQMGTNIKLAVLAAEDQLFADHDGFDLKAIKRAIKYNQRHPQKQRGASTISQQTAKNIFLWQGGGFLRKGLEVYFTFNIEQIWTKQTILERYLNIAEMGKGIFGIQAASKFYFHKDAKNLTKAEAAQIAACLPNPKRLTVKPLSSYVAKRAAVIARQMNILETDFDVQALIK